MNAAIKKRIRKALNEEFHLRTKNSLPDTFRTILEAKIYYIVKGVKSRWTRRRKCRFKCKCGKINKTFFNPYFTCPYGVCSCGIVYGIQYVDSFVDDDDCWYKIGNAVEIGNVSEDKIFEALKAQ